MLQIDKALKYYDSAIEAKIIGFKSPWMTTIHERIPTQQGQKI
jgi:hypothetical protein